MYLCEIGYDTLVDKHSDKFKSIISADKSQSDALPPPAV